MSLPENALLIDRFWFTCHCFAENRTCSDVIDWTKKEDRLSLASLQAVAMKPKKIFKLSHFTQIRLVSEQSSP